MSTNHAAFEEFFRDYAATSRDPSAERIAAFYAPSFIAGGPRGSAVFNNDAAFLDWLRNLHEFENGTVREMYGRREFGFLAASGRKR